MTRISLSRTIAAPVERVFSAITAVETLPEVIPEVIRVELLSASRTGPGTRFREVRLMHGKELVTELELTELVENERVRMAAESHGTVWDMLFTVQESDGGTLLQLRMESRAHSFLPMLVNPLVKGLIKKGVQKHMDAVRDYCQSGGGS